MTSDDITQRALDALDALVTAFAANDEDAYFGSFAPHARLVLPGIAEAPIGLDDYRQRWRAWCTSGWAVASCRSSHRDVLVAESAAIITHHVHTVLTDGTELSERETVIVDMSTSTGKVIYEHLSS